MSSTGSASPLGPPQEDPGGSAAALDADAILRARPDEPSMGWRRALLRATGGVINPGPSAAEVRWRDLLHRIRRPLIQSHRIAVSLGVSR